MDFKDVERTLRSCFVEALEPVIAPLSVLI